MVQCFKRLVRRMLYSENASSESFIKYLKKGGAYIGENVTIYAPNKTLIDTTAPWLLKIGNNVRIAEGAKILTHDYSWSVLKCYSSDNVKPGAILGAQSAVEIGDNVFIGMNAIITRGVKIGKNVIIGAGSVVTKDCADNGVYAGNPAKLIMNIEDFYYKRQAQQFSEAKDMVIKYRQRFSKQPPKEVFSEYFMLFSSKDDAVSVDKFRKQMETSMNYEKCLEYIEAHKPMFADYEQFLQECYK